MNQIKVFAPATVANVACGFDVMGFAIEGIGDELTITKTDVPGLKITEIHGCEGLPTDSKKNVATVAVQSLLDSLKEKQSGGFEFKLNKNVIAGSGLGSSASSSSAAVFGVNKLLGDPFTKNELVYFAMQGEFAASGNAHADNVAPSILGGFTLVRSYDPLDIILLDYPDELFVSIIHPQIEIKTSDSKKILRKEISLKDAITQWGNVGGLVSGLSKGDYDLIGRSMQDVVAEPVRSMLIPLFDEIKTTALSNGALGCSISGSGPSIFALSKSFKTAKLVSSEFKNIYDSNDIESIMYVSKINPKGAEVIK